MTDIVFLLLIFFIVLSTLVSPYGENIKLPSGRKNPPPKTDQTFKVTLQSNSTILLNGREVSEETIATELERMKDDPVKPPLVLNAAASVPAGLTMKIFSLAKQNEFEVVLQAQTR